MNLTQESHSCLSVLILDGDVSTSLDIAQDCSTLLLLFFFCFRLIVAAEEAAEGEAVQAQREEDAPTWTEAKVARGRRGWVEQS